MCSTGVLLVRSFVVLLCLAAVAIHLTLAKVLAAGTGDGLLSVPKKASLANCPSRCGDVKISYPFGIGLGCFRQGLELTCNNTTGSPRLLFLGNNSTQVTYIDICNNYVLASAVGYNITMGLGDVDTYTQSWEAPTGVVFDEYNRLYIVGCGVEVYMFSDNMTDLIGYCTSICADNREIMERKNMGYGPVEGLVAATSGYQ